MNLQPFTSSDQLLRSVPQINTFERDHCYQKKTVQSIARWGFRTFRMKTEGLNLPIDFGKIQKDWNMGGRGSGRRHQGGEATTEDISSIDIRLLHRTQDISDPITRTVTWSRGGVTHTTMTIEKTIKGLLFSYLFRQYGTEPVQVERYVTLQFSDTQFGGRRPWFTCPNCKRRTAIVFISRGIGCRKCFGIRHQSQNECASDRAIRRIDFLREKLKWQPGFLNGPEWRPPGMHHATYYRLLSEYRTITNFVNVSIAYRFGFAARELDMYIPVGDSS